MGKKLIAFIGLSQGYIDGHIFTIQQRLFLTLFDMDFF